LAPGALAGTRFRLNATGDADDRFVFDTTTKTLSFDANGSGAGGAVALVVIGNFVGTANNLAATDIIIV
jgi:hypothetical protein